MLTGRNTYIRRVIEAAGRTLEQNNYYPLGMLFGTCVGESNKQPYKFTGKEYITAKGYNIYDFGIRGLNPATGLWGTPDPLCEKNPHISLYAYCLNNPVKYIDPDGKREWPVNATYNGYKRRHENNFGYARNNNRTHKGLDINLGSKSQDLGAPVFATHSGSATKLRIIPNGDKDAGGNRVEITAQGGNVSTYYMHLETITEGLKIGAEITQGTQIGTLGGSGGDISNKYTPHLHYELSIDGEKIDPVRSLENLLDPQAYINGVILPETIVSEKKQTTENPSTNNTRN